MQIDSEAGQALTVEELTQLFSVLSHDLKSPIFSIDGFSDLLLGDYQDKLDEEGQDFLRRIRSSVQQMKKVLDEMSRLIKLLGRPNVPRPTPLREILEEVILKCNYQIEEGAVKIEIPDDLQPVVIRSGGSCSRPGYCRACSTLATVASFASRIAPLAPWISG